MSVNAGSLTIENNASLIQEDDVENTGNITVLRNSNLLFKHDYTVWSSPVLGQNLQEFSPATLPDRFYRYGINGSGNEAYIAIDPSTNFQEGSGYLIRMPDQVAAPNTQQYNAGTQSAVHEGEFIGVSINGTVAIPMSVSANYTSMVGNPYPSPINVAEFFAANASVLSTSYGLYFWRKRNNADATSYATLNLVAYVANDGGVLNGVNGVFNDVNNYGGQQWENYFGTTPANEWTIASGQGFYVVGNVSGGSLNFTNMMRASAGAGQPFFRMSPPVQPAVSRLWLNLNNDTNFSQTAIAYTDIATNGIDFGMDSKQLTGGNIALYSMAEDEKLGIQARPAFTVSDIVPLGFTVVNAGDYSISLHRKDGLFEDGQTVYLKDNHLQATYNLAQGPYNFTTDSGMFDDRFEIIFSNEVLSGASPTIDSNTVVVYKKNENLHINSGNAVMSSVSIYDVRGRLVYEREKISNTDLQISDLEIEQQVIIVKIKTEEGAVVSKKVVF